MLYILVGTIFLLIGCGIATLFWVRIIYQVNDERRKINNYYHLFEQWMSNLENNQKTEMYFHKNGYKNIAIYGMKELGEHLLNSLSGTDICVKYVVDRNLTTIPAGIKGYLPDDNLPQVDVIVITASHYYAEIREKLKHWGYDIVSIDDVVCSRFTN